MQWLRRLPLRFKIAGIGGMMLSLMLVAIPLLRANVDAMIRLDQEKDRTLQIAERLDHLMIALIDMETGVRGYIITADSAFLDSYHAGAAAYPQYVQELQQLLEADPVQTERLHRVRYLADRWTSEVLNPEIALVRSDNDASHLVASRAGKVLLDQIRQTLGEVEQAKEQQIEDLLAEIQRREMVAEYATWLAVITATVLGLSLSFRVARSITAPIDRLLEATERVAAGEYGREANVNRVDEIGQLAASFNRMSQALLQHHGQVAAQRKELQAQQEELAAQNEELQAQQELLGSTMADMERDRDRLERLNQFGRGLVSSTDVQSLAERLLEELLGAGDAQVGALFIWEETQQIAVASHVGLTEDAARITRSTGLMTRAAETGEPLIASFPHGELLRPVYHTEVPVEHELYLPVRFAGETIALAVLGRTGAQPFDPMETHWLGVMASQAGASLSNRIAFEKLKGAYADLQENAAHIEELTAQVEEQRDHVAAERDNLNAILETTSEGIWLIDATGATLLVNNRFWELTDVVPNPEVTLAEVVRDMSPRVKNGQAIKDYLGRMSADPYISTSALIEMSAPAEMVLHSYTAPVTGQGGRLIGRLFVLRDVTRETEIDRMKTEFISTVSHELRTPLTSIRGYVDLILDGDVGPVAEDQREFLELVSRNTVRLANLINDLLDVEKIEHGRIQMRRERIDLGAILRETAATFRVSAAEKGLTYEVALQEPLPAVEGDPDRLTQVFTNLLSNAVKYTKRGSVQLRARQEGAHVLVEIADSGIGIAKDHLPYLFTKFFRVDNQYTREVGGTGLGLAITKAIVERHHGRIDLESEPGQGTTFRILLPALSDSDESPTEPASPLWDGQDAPLVLIIEDEADVARLIAQHVTRQGLRAMVASSGAEGLQKAAEAKPDLITLDVMLPEIDGFEVIAQLKSNPVTASIPVVFLSIVEETEKGVRLGAGAYLTKPINAPQLSATLRELLPHKNPT